MAEHPAPDRAAGPEAKPLRLFLAADMPRDHEREIDRTVAPWRERYPEGRWEAPEKWHVTLKFLGPTQPRLLPEVESAARQAAAAVEPFQLELGHLGIFPGPRRARVLWVALDDPAEGLRRLAEGLEKRLGGEFPAEKRGFNAHLTVARFRQPVRVEEPEALAASRVGGDPFVVDHILLYRSHLLGPKGSRYEVVSTYPLGHG
jgi:2'-5' RNA ligase